MVKKLLLLSTIGLLLFSCKKDKEVTPDETTTTDNTSTSGNGTNSKNIQQRLDGGELPVTIYNSDTTLLDSLYGKSYAGGLIIYLNMGDSSGMVASSVDQTTSIQWGCNTQEVGFTECPFGHECFTIATAMNHSIGGGKQNTEEITDFCSSSAAKKSKDLILNGYSDWFMPSRDEAQAMYDKLNLTGTYWTSTQRSNDRAWAASTGKGQATTYTLPKSGYKKVRSVRSF